MSIIYRNEVVCCTMLFVYIGDRLEQRCNAVGRLFVAAAERRTKFCYPPAGE